MLKRSVILNAVGQVGSLAIGFVGSILLARLLGPADRGLLAIMVSVYTMTLALAGAGLPFAAAYFAARPGFDGRAVLGNTLLYGVLLGAVLVPVFYLLRKPLSDAFTDGQGGATWALAAGLIPLAFLQYTTAGHSLALLRFKAFNVLLLTSRVVYLLGIVVLLGAVGLGVAGALTALAFSTAALVGALLVMTVRHIGRPRLSLDVLRQMIGYGTRVQVGAIFRLVNLRFDVIILQAFRPLSEVGHYVVAVVMAEIVLALARSFQQSVLPLVSRDAGEAQAETTSNALRHHGILAAAGIVALALVGPFVVLYGFGREFEAAIVPMLILLPGMWFLGAGTVAGTDLAARNRPGLGSLLSAITVVVTVALDVLLIPVWGAEGAAAASALAYLAFGLASLFALARVSGIGVRDLAVARRADLALYGRLLRRRSA